MRESGLDLFDPRTTVDESDYSSSPTNARDPDFGFAFNDSNFSDRVLQIEIIDESPGTGAESDGCHNLADWAVRKSKRHRGDIIEKDNDMCRSFAALDVNSHPDVQILDSQQPDIDDGVGDGNHDEEEIPMLKELASGIKF